MGITIFARGKIDRIEDLPRLIDDLKDVAGKRNWKYRVLDDDFDATPNAVLTHGASDRPGAVIEGSLGLKGVILNIPGAEMFAVLFDRSGVLTDMFQQLAWIEGKGQNERLIMCKTQFASIDAHIALVELLDSLKRKYISNLTVTDEGAYWETRDRRILAEKRILLGHYLRRTEKVLSGIELSDEERKDPEAIADRIEEALLRAEDDEDRGGPG